MPEDIKADVLLVDDEEQFLKVLSQRLEGRGMKVDTSTTGEDALKTVKGKEFDATYVIRSHPVLENRFSTDRPDRNAAAESPDSASATSP